MSPSIKRILLFLPALCVIVFFMIKKWQEYDKRQQKIAERQQYLQSLACVPKQEIDKKTLFANVMKQFWEYEIRDLWKQDKGLESVYTETNLVQSSCGLEEPYRMTKETCYPWQVPYQNLEELYSELSKENTTYQYNDKHNKFTNRMLALNAKAYHPNKDNNIYLNNSNYFSIIKRASSSTLFYPANCCQFYSYKEIEKNHLLDEVFFGKGIKFQDIDKQTLYKINFIRIEAYYIDDCHLDDGYNGCIGTNLSKKSLSKQDFFDYIQLNGKRIVYYPVSQCGKLGIFQPSQ